MPTYNLNNLGSEQFEQLVQSLLKEIIGDGTTTFGPGPDGAREATFQGSASYPSKRTSWSGNWIFQAKFHDTSLLGTDRARAEVLSDLASELDKITLKYKLPCDNYILFTNVPLTGVFGTGNIDKISNQIAPDHQRYIENVDVLGAADINRLLDKYPNVRRSYLHFIVAGDLIAELITERQERLNDVALTIQSYISKSFSHEQDAQLDQAGNVSDDAIRLQKIFFDLYAAQDRQFKGPTESRKFRARFAHFNHNDRFLVVRMLLAEDINRVVIVGGPGEGKSTLGQYLAQLHRAFILKKISDVALNDDYIPHHPRIPFRIILRDFAQWLAKANTSGQTTTLDEYITQQIHRHTGRHISTVDLHRVMGQNPILLNLDGLDEVTDQDLKVLLMARIRDFTDTCELLEADMLIVATTRPNSYSEQFDPEEYLHVRLTKLEHAQVRSYVQKWTHAKDLALDKRDKLISTMEDCLSDSQIRLLATTPLQVTILILIVSVGGLPPDQREALFNEYLEVIYKRETAKDKHLIATDKELLIGLHKYVGYLLQERVTQAIAADSVIPEGDYVASVTQYLKANDPYKPAAERKAEIRVITKDVGERLVLIVEPHSGVWGFELRAIQEFFAAAHLADTAKDTVERYDRFAAIARLAHWRTVALFFAGRIGRNYSGETSNIVEVCREIDRSGIDKHAERGAMLALELAADRAFGPNRRRQESLLEVGLRILDGPYAAPRASKVAELLARMSEQDQRDLALPILQQKLDSLQPALLSPTIRVISGIAPDRAKSAIQKLGREPGHADEGFRLSSGLATTHHKLPPTELRSIVDTLDAASVGSTLSDLPFDVAWRVVNDLEECGCPKALLLESISNAFARRYSRWATDSEGARDLVSVLQRPWPTTPAAMTMRYIALGEYLSVFIHSAQRRQISSDTELPVSLDEVAERSSAVLRAREVDDFPPLQALMWMLYFQTARALDPELTARFVDFAIEHRSDRSIVQAYTSRHGAQFYPLILFRALVSSPKNYSREDLCEFLWRYGGIENLDRSEHRVGEALRLIQSMPADVQTKVRRYGVIAIADPATRSEILSGFEGPFGALLLDHYLVSNDEGRRTYEYDTLLIELVLDELGRDLVLSVPRSLIIGYFEPGYASAARLDPKFAEQVLARLIEFPDFDDSARHCQGLLVTALESEVVDIDLIGRSYAYLGSRGRELRLYSRHLRGISSVLRHALPVAALAIDTAERRGARSVVHSLSFSRAYAPFEGPAGVPRFARFAEMHRALAKMPDAESRSLALALFGVRPPSTASDWKMLRSLILNAVVDGDIEDMSFVLRGSKATAMDSAKMIDILHEVLDSQPGLDANSRAFVLSWLDDLLLDENQSLRLLEGQLGLPLQAD